VDHFEKVRTEVKLAGGDYIDLKLHEPAMRHVIDTYIRADDSVKVSAFDDISLVQLIVERGVEAVKASLPERIRKNEEALAETIENNVRKLIVDEQRDQPEVLRGDVPATRRFETALPFLSVAKKKGGFLLPGASQWSDVERKRLRKSLFRCSLSDRGNRQVIRSMP